jgi:hypothetical protein
MSCPFNIKKYKINIRMSVFMEGISISEIKQNNKTKKRTSTIKYDGKKAKVMCNNNGKKTFMTLNNDQIKTLMALPASKKTLKQRLMAVAKSKSKKRKRTHRKRKKRGGRTRKRRRRKRR